MAIEKNMLNELIQEEIPYTILVNESLNKITDAAALGIYVYLAAKPRGWIIRNSELADHFGKGRDFIKQKLAYLRNIGALLTEKVRDECGKIVKHQTTVKKAWHTTVLKIQPLDIHAPGNPSYGESTTIKKRKILTRKEVNNISCANAQKDDELPPQYQETYYPINSEQKESDETFEAFWEMYPKKKSKLRAQAAWHSQKCSKRAHEILAKLDEQVKKDRQFIEGYAPNPDKYIHQELWNDEITPVVTAKKNNFANLDQNSDWHKEFHKDRF